MLKNKSKFVFVNVKYSLRIQKLAIVSKNCLLKKIVFFPMHLAYISISFFSLWQMNSHSQYIHHRNIPRELNEKNDSKNNASKRTSDMNRLKHRLTDLIGGNTPWFNQTTYPIPFYIRCLKSQLILFNMNDLTEESFGWRQVFLLSVIQNVCRCYLYGSEAPIVHIRTFMKKYDDFFQTCTARSDSAQMVRDQKGSSGKFMTHEMQRNLVLEKDTAFDGTICRMWSKLKTYVESCNHPSPNSVLPVPRHIIGILERLAEDMRKVREKKSNARQADLKRDSKLFQDFSESAKVDTKVSVSAESKVKVDNDLKQIDAASDDKLSIFFDAFDCLQQTNDRLSGINASNTLLKWATQSQGRNAHSCGAAFETHVFDLKLKVCTGEAEAAPFRSYSATPPSPVIQRISATCMRLMLPLSTSTNHCLLSEVGWKWFQFCQDLGGLQKHSIDSPLDYFINHIVDGDEQTKGWPVPILVRNMVLQKKIIFWNCADEDSACSSFHTKKTSQKGTKDVDITKCGNKTNPFIDHRFVSLGEYDACVFDARTGAIVIFCECKKNPHDIPKASRQRQRSLSLFAEYHLHALSKLSQAAQISTDELHAEEAGAGATHELESRKKGTQIDFELVFRLPPFSGRGGSRAAEALGADISLVLCSKTNGSHSTRVESMTQHSVLEHAEFFWKRSPGLPKTFITYSDELGGSQCAITQFCLQPTNRWIFVTDDVAPQSLVSSSLWKHVIILGLAAHVAPYLFYRAFQISQTMNRWSTTLVQQQKLLEEFGERIREEEKNLDAAVQALQSEAQARVEKNSVDEFNARERETAVSKLRKQHDALIERHKLMLINSVIHLWWQADDGIQLLPGLQEIVDHYRDRNWRICNKELFTDPNFMSITQRVTALWKAESRDGALTPAALINEMLSPSPSSRPSAAQSKVAQSLNLENTLIVARYADNRGSENTSSDVVLSSIMDFF